MTEYSITEIYIYIFKTFFQCFKMPTGDAYRENIINVSDNSLFGCVQILDYIQHYRKMYIYLKRLIQCLKMPTGDGRKKFK